MQSSYSTSRRTELKGFSSSSVPYSIIRPSLYHRSDRRWVSAYSLPNKAAWGWPATWMRSGVEPPDPAVPNGRLLYNPGSASRVIAAAARNGSSPTPSASEVRPC